MTYNRKHEPKFSILMDLTIQIINYNTKYYLKKCLRTLFNDLADANFEYEINMLDNNSNDDLSDLRDNYKDRKDIFFYSSKSNLGFGGGHNLLAKKSNAKYLLILNTDIQFIEKNTITQLLYKIVKEKIRIKVIGPRLTNVDGKNQEWDHGELGSAGIRSFILNNTGDSYWKNRNKEVQVAWVSGAVFLIEKEIFDKMDGFDEKFFLYKEEEDLCLRIRNNGGGILYYPNVKVLHHGSVVACTDKYMSASRQYFIEKHFKDKRMYGILKFMNKPII